MPEARKATDLPDSFWELEVDELQNVLMPLMQEAAKQAVAQIAAEAEALGAGVDWTLVNTAAAKWAREYTAKLVKGITDTTNKAVAEAVAGWIETPGATLGDLIAQLDDLMAFDIQRAQTIAVTEVTRAYTQGNLATGREVEKLGFFTYRKKWNTNNDEIVQECPICWPLHNQTVDGIDAEFDTEAGPLDGPPAHPRCRCWITMAPVVGD